MANETVHADGVNIDALLDDAIMEHLRAQITVLNWVHRVSFERGSDSKKLRKRGSFTAWPFPHALMLGYQAEYAGGDIVCAPGEIEDARFFHVDALPPLFPIRYAMANQLLRDFCLRHGRPWPPAQATPAAA